MDSTASSSNGLSGVIDGLDGYCLHGWIRDPGAPTRRIAFDVFADGHKVGSGVADRKRPDLASLFNTDGNHGFRIAIETPWIGEVTLSLRESGTGSPINTPEFIVAFDPSKDDALGSRARKQLALHRAAGATSDIAAVTIVSKNYLSAARVLCESFLEHHPGANFFVLLVDELQGRIDPRDEQFTLLTVDDIPLPSKDAWLYQYTILELNTAVKPFMLRYLLDSFPQIKRIAYIDPDIRIYQPMAMVWEGLESNDVVVTPHMRRPFHDTKRPTEVGILQSGTYNLGFVGLRRGDEVDRLLDWWMEKLYLDCVVDIPNGLFTDQKWMDLVPGYFEHVRILRDPGYNVAYWNLHERKVTFADNGTALVDESPLVFFHFSGYSPLVPHKLSKHQSRHDLLDLPGVRRLCDDYADKLREHGADETRRWPYAFAKLPNGIPVTTAMHWVIRHCHASGIPFPSPKYSAEEFCRFLMTPTAKMPGGCVPPIAAGLLKRQDVAAHYPGASWNHRDPGFESWIRNSGAVEENLSLLIKNFWPSWISATVVERALFALESRKDLQARFPDVLNGGKSFDDFAAWIGTFGTKEAQFLPEDEGLLRAARGGYGKVLNLYFSRPDLQKSFPLIHTAKNRNEFFAWLVAQLGGIHDLSTDEIYWFRAAAQANEATLLPMNLAYNTHLRRQARGILSIFSVTKFQPYVGDAPGAYDSLIKWLLSEDAPMPLQQLEAHYASKPELRNAHPAAFASREALKDLLRDAIDSAELPSAAGIDDWLLSLTAAVDGFDPDRKRITVAGFTDATTGMGQSVRSLLLTLRETDAEISVVTLPTLLVDPDEFGRKGNPKLPYGWPGVASDRFILVANADSVAFARETLPATCWLAKRRIGYWVWETEELPASQAKAAEYFDEIWTPSEYSEAAIRVHVSLPTRVVPHALDIDELKAAKRSRREFGLPEEATIFGYFFDQRSYIQRKNPIAVVHAFREAYGNDPNSLLVIKVNNLVPGNFEYEQLKSSINFDNVRIIEATWDRARTLRLLASLDGYLSLHRSEGFGLVIAEAMACGVTPFASGYSGNLEFMKNCSDLLIPTRQKTTVRPYGAYPRSSRWGEPSVRDTVSRLQRWNTIQVGSRTKIASVLSLLSPETVARQLSTGPDLSGKQ